MKVIPVLICIFAVIGSGHTRSSGRSDSYHLQDLLDYTCTHISAIDHLKYFFPDDWSSNLSSLETVILPICSYILQVADNFDVNEFCKFTTHYFQAIGLYQDSAGRYLPTNPLQIEFMKMLQRLYGIDLADLTRTLCPNAYRFFEPPLKELVDEFLTEFFTVVLSKDPKDTSLLKDVDSICQDRNRKRGMPNGSRLPEILRDLCSDFAGYESFDSFCEDITLTISQDYTSRRKSLKKIVLTVRERVLGILGIEINSTKLKEEL